MTEQKPPLDALPLEQGPVHFKSRYIAMRLEPRDIIRALIEMFRRGNSPTEQKSATV